jgi:mono/diheme cytochrome c family protein
VKDPIRLAPSVAIAAVIVAVGCGGEVTVSEDQVSLRQGARLFEERCSGCHSLEPANSYGSKPERQLQHGERTNGPNFNTRRVGRDDALFAIRNGGFSGAIMPANIVVGGEADRVADFLAACTGKPGQRDAACGE